MTKKTLLSIAFAITLLAAFHSRMTLADAPKPRSNQQASATIAPENTEIQYGGFVALTLELRELRETRRVPVEKFVQMSREPNTIILDTRSKDSFDKVHIDGAIHLNFSDFTDAKLRLAIPTKSTRILIYCNNNFVDTPKKTASADALNLENRLDVIQGLTDKRPALALNIPTFINLHGYGYENVFELADRLNVSDSRISLVGSSVDQGGQ